jgi:hypothetical protein
VWPEKGEIDVACSTPSVLSLVKQRLRDLGYPEHGTTAGLEKITTNLKSFVSCAVGRFGASGATDC